MVAEKHLEILTERKNEYTIFVREGSKVEKISDCKILAMDEVGVTFEEMNRVAKNRINFVPYINLVRIRSELV
ncbi:MAG: hypothetical protein D6732_09805 [Methanobacteriota archaeon]|nr:MAG: hypothetical protein D6732_09805 [Euryarchaeota archaeon]